jgi:hypothetical protein
MPGVHVQVARKQLCVHRQAIWQPALCCQGLCIQRLTRNAVCALMKTPCNSEHAHVINSQRYNQVSLQAKDSMFFQMCGHQQQLQCKMVAVLMTAGTMLQCTWYAGQ